MLSMASVPLPWGLKWTSDAERRVVFVSSDTERGSEIGSARRLRNMFGVVR